MEKRRLSPGGGEDRPRYQLLDAGAAHVPGVAAAGAAKAAAAVMDPAAAGDFAGELPVAAGEEERRDLHLHRAVVADVEAHPRLEEVDIAARPQLEEPVAGRDLERPEAGLVLFARVAPGPGEPDDEGPELEPAGGGQDRLDDRRGRWKGKVRVHEFRDCALLQRFFRLRRHPTAL